MRRVFLKDLTNDSKEYTITQQEREFQHIKKVLRAKLREQFEVFNGKGLKGIGEIVELRKNFITFKITSLEEVEVFKSKVNVAIPVIKHNPFNFIMRSLIQLRVNRIIPYISEFSFNKNYPNNKYEKWNQIIIEASKQSGNNHLILFDKIYNLTDVINIESKLKIAFDKSSEKLIKDLDEDIKNSESILIVIGPEGGLSEFEISFLKENNFTICKLDSNVLRSEVATITSISIVKYIAGEI